MLAVVSDLHLQHTAHDRVRFVSRDRVWESGVSRNVTSGAFRLLFTEIRDAAERCRARRVDLVLAGDILDLVRSPIWLWGGATHPRPWDDVQGAHGDAMRRRVLQVLDRIEEECAECLEALRGVARDGTFRIHGEAVRLAEEVRVHFLPGNHDRLANLWPDVRARVAQMLGAPAPHVGFPHELSDALLQSAYGARVRHGHEYDKFNFALDIADEPALEAGESDYAAPVFGDFMALDVAVRLPLAFRAFHALSLRRDDEVGERFRRMHAALSEMDDVRPQRMLGRYLRTQMRPGELEALRPVVRNLADLLRTDPFFADEAARVGVEVPRAKLELAVRFAAIGDLLDGLVETLDGSGGGAPSPATCAALERTVGSPPPDVVIAGHTHYPDVVPLPPGGSGEAPFFLDTGTWRTLVRGEPDCFGRLRTYTMVLCFDPDERARFDDLRRFQTWTGHLASAADARTEPRSFGPYLRRGEPLDPSCGALVFTSLRVDAVDEGTRGAELRLCLGVDGTELTVRLGGVRAGDTFDLTRVGGILRRGCVDPERREPALEPRIPLHAALDGEVWAYGAEEDLGASGFPAVLDLDDPLPFAITSLGRTGAGFAQAKGELLLEDHGRTRIRIGYRVDV